ncbi:MAG: thioredoxin-dependent thiol peroxidase [Lentisphaerae bacterium]|nr:MAG: thioredoxin-dependent thiol peroxidase [Lentisphaerota bacterium]
MLKPGDPAPDFKGIDQDGNPVSLKDFQGKTLILYFYPKDNTPGCTKEACSLRDASDFFSEHGIEVLGVSADSPQSHVKFREKYNLPFRLIADTQKDILRAYGAWGLKKRCGREYEGIIRKTFVIGPDGKILHVIDKVKTDKHAAQIRELLGLA